jgi:hypothetical protein
MKIFFVGIHTKSWVGLHKKYKNNVLISFFDFLRQDRAFGIEKRFKEFLKGKK